MLVWTVNSTTTCSLSRIEAVGIRSLKVKRLKAEKAARAKDLRMKAESAAAGKEKMYRNRWAAAIKIQVSKKEHNRRIIGFAS